MYTLKNKGSALIRRRDFLRFGAAGTVSMMPGGLFNRSALAQSAANCKVGGPFNLFTWQGYEGTGLPQWDSFWPKNGIDLNVKPIGSENMAQFLKGPGGDQWDAYSVNQGDNNRFDGLGILSPITVEEVPNLKKMYSALADSPIWKVGDGVYNSVPLTVGPLGMNWVTSRFPKGFTHYDQALDPKIRVGTYDSANNMIPVAACAVGLDPGKLTRDQLNGPVKDWLRKLRPQLKVISASLGDQLTVLINNDVDVQLVGLMWFVQQGVQQGIDIGFTIPAEGSFGFVDSIGITPFAKNRCNALAYANAGLDPDMGARLNDTLFSLGPTPEINAALSENTRSHFPKDIDRDFFGKLKWNISYVDPKGEYATAEEWSALWNEVKLAQ